MIFKIQKAIQLIFGTVFSTQFMRYNKKLKAKMHHMIFIGEKRCKKILFKKGPRHTAECLH